MAMNGRIRAALPLLNQIVKSADPLSSSSSSHLSPSLLLPSLSSTPSTSFTSRSYASAAAGETEKKVKLPLALFGGSGNYASALYLAAKKTNVLDKVESEIHDLVEGMKGTSTFSQFVKDLSVPVETRVKAIEDICAQAKFSKVTNNFLVMLAENGRLKNLDTIAKKFEDLAMADKGVVKVLFTSVIPLPPEEEKELKETLRDVLGQGKQVILEQKIDHSILGGLVIEFGLKVLDMSVKTRAQQMERFLREPINFDAL